MKKLLADMDHLILTWIYAIIGPVTKLNENIHHETRLAECHLGLNQCTKKLLFHNTTIPTEKSRFLHNFENP